MRTRRGIELEPLRDVGDRIAREHPDAALERLVLEDRPDEGPQRGRAAAHGDGLIGLRDLDAVEEVVDVVAELADLARGRRVLRAGTRRSGAPEPILKDLTQLTPSATVPMMISLEPPPTSTTPMSPLTGWPRVFVAPTNASRPSSCSERISISTPAISRDLAHRLLAVAGLADRRGRDGPDRLGAELLGEPDLGRHDLAHLGDLLRGDAAVTLRVGADLRVGALLHDLAELALLRLGDEHARGVRADVDRRAEHRLGGSRVWQTGRITHACAIPRITACSQRGSPPIHPFRPPRPDHDVECPCKSPYFPASATPLRGTRRPPSTGSHGRLGLTVPHEWWPSAHLLKSFEAAGFALRTGRRAAGGRAREPTPLHAPRDRAARGAWQTTGLRPIAPRPGRPAARQRRRRPCDGRPDRLRGRDRRRLRSCTTRSRSPTIRRARIGCGSRRDPSAGRRGAPPT